MDGRCCETGNDLRSSTRERADSRASSRHVVSGDEDMNHTVGTGDGGARDSECGSLVVYTGDAKRRERLLNLSWEADSAW